MDMFLIFVGFHMMKVNMVESWRQFSHSEKLCFAFVLISLSVLPHIMITKTSRLFVHCHKLGECGV